MSCTAFTCWARGSVHGVRPLLLSATTQGSCAQVGRTSEPQATGLELGGARSHEVWVTCPLPDLQPFPPRLPTSPRRLSERPAFRSPRAPHLCPPRAAFSGPCPPWFSVAFQIKSTAEGSCVTLDQSLHPSKASFLQMAVVVKISQTQGCETMCVKGLLLSSVLPSLSPWPGVEGQHHLPVLTPALPQRGGLAHASPLS